MIVVRNVFQLKFGRAKEAASLWKQGVAIANRVAKGRGSTRLLADLVGPSYTLVVENTFESLADFEAFGPTLQADPEWRDWYPQFVPLAQEGVREIYTILK